MAIVLQLESAQQYMALMMILGHEMCLHDAFSMPYISCASEISQVLSPVLFPQSLYFSLLIH